MYFNNLHSSIIVSGGLIHMIRCIYIADGNDALLAAESVRTAEGLKQWSYWRTESQQRHNVICRRPTSSILDIQSTVHMK